MVNFDFTVTDEEAELIMDCMNSARLKAFEAAAFGILQKKTPEYIEWMRRHSQLIATVIRKMKTTRT